jgi:hypothetical protein
MVTHRWWGSKFCKRTCKNAYLRENHNTLSGWVIFAAAVAVVALALPFVRSNAAPAEEQSPAGASLDFDKKDGTLYIESSGPIVAGMADDLREALGKYQKRVVAARSTDADRGRDLSFGKKAAGHPVGNASITSE